MVTMGNPNLLMAVMAVITYVIAYVAARELPTTIVDRMAPYKVTELFYTVMYGGEEDPQSDCHYLKFFADFDDNNRDGPAVSFDVAISEFYDMIEVVTSGRNRGTSQPSVPCLTLFLSFSQSCFSDHNTDFHSHPLQAIRLFLRCLMTVQSLRTL